MPPLTLAAWKSTQAPDDTTLARCVQLCELTCLDFDGKNYICEMYLDTADGSIWSKALLDSGTRWTWCDPQADAKTKLMEQQQEQFITIQEQAFALARATQCPTCNAEPGQPCISTSAEGRVLSTTHHFRRLKEGSKDASR